MSHPGLETALALERSKLTTATHGIVIFFHWKLNSLGLRCIGTESATEQSGSPSELLPSGWENGPFAFKYRTEKSDIVLLKVSSFGDDATVTLSMVGSDSDSSGGLSIKPSDYVRLSDGKPIDTTDPKQFFVELDKLDSMCGEQFAKLSNEENKKESTSSASSSQRNQGPGHENVGPGQGPRVGVFPEQPARSRYERHDPLAVGPPRIGGSDLDPLGGMMGGGMLMEPPGFGGRRGGPGLGGGMEPRWDPVGPLGGDAGPFGPPGGPGGLFGGRGRGGRGGGGGMFGGGGNNFGDDFGPPGWNMFM